MVLFTVRVKVADYAKWKAVFDESQSIRRAAGSTGVNHIYRDVDDPNTLTIMMEWDTADKARAFMNDPALRERQQRAGALGPPAVSAILSAA
jgi:heme-degrading monooxygenase HmoA